MPSPGWPAKPGASPSDRGTGAPRAPDAGGGGRQRFSRPAAPPPEAAAEVSGTEAAPADGAAEPPRRELRGVVERITYQNPENGYTVARLAPERPTGDARAVREQAGDYLVTLVGTLADLSPGEAIVAHGWWKNDAKYGWQFVAADYRTALPATIQGMKKYLGSGLVKGVGPINAGRIVDVFGEATFEIIDSA